MVAAAIWACILLVGLDILCLLDNRKILFQFLQGRYNRKHAKEIHKEQNLWERISLSYIKPHLKRYIRDFVFFHRIYCFLIAVIVPQYVFLIITAVRFSVGRQFLLFCILPAIAVKILFEFIFSIVLGPSRISKYGK